jgi:hypothetical protein
LANQPLWPAAFKFKRARVRGSFRARQESQCGNEFANEFGRHELSFEGITDHFIRQPTSESLCQFGCLLFAGIDHIDRTAIPRMFERKRHDFPDTDESQPEFDIPAQILEPGLRNRLKSSLVALPSNECDKCLLDVERGAVAPTVERKQHIALATQVDQLLQLVREREIPHRHPHDDAISPLEA